MMETIHHIEPPQKALSFAYNYLNPNGYIIISDTNGFNPPVQIKLFLERGFNLHREVVDPNTGEIVPYGNENIFTVWRAKRMLEEAGFKIEKISYQRFLPSFKCGEKYSRIFKRIEDLMRKPLS